MMDGYAKQIPRGGAGGDAISPECDLRCVRVDDILPDDVAYASAHSRLPEWRRRKAEAFRFTADRRRSVAAWLLLRQMLREKGLDADSLAVSENAFGKPAFDPPIGLHFNLSHAGDRVMVALANAEVGCDVERVVSIADEIIRVSLAAAEREILANLTGAARDLAFIRLWARKESYVKAVGKGMDFDPPTFSALGQPPTSDWIWQDFDFGDGHLGCLCRRIDRKAHG